MLYQSTHGFTSRPSVGYDLLNRSWRVCEVMERNSTNRPREKNGTRIVVSKDFLLRHSSRRFFHINSLYLAKSLALAIVERMALHTTTPRNEELHGIVYEWENYASDPQKYLFCFAFATPFPLCQLITVGPLDFYSGIIYARVCRKPLKFQWDNYTTCSCVSCVSWLLIW